MTGFSAGKGLSRGKGLNTLPGLSTGGGLSPPFQDDAAPGAPVSVVSPILTGSATVGQTLSCTQGVWTGDPVITYAYRWQADSVVIAGANASTYLLTAAETAKYVTCEVIATNGVGSTTRESNSQGPISGTPINLTVPIVTGTTLVGQTLSCSTGTWQAFPTPTYAYQWRADGINIAGQISSTYILTANESGKLITCGVVATNGVGSSPSAFSASVGPVNMSPANTVAPVASGTASVGSVVSTTNGTWNGYPVPTYTYQWKRNGVAIGGGLSNAQTYTIVSADVGANIKCTVVATNTYGAAPIDSNILGPVAGIPANTVAPVISGTATVGQTLSTTNGTWTGSPAPTFAYQWTRNGVNIGSATASTYLLASADASANIFCKVTATNASGSTTAASNTIGPINMIPANTVAPVISGNIIVGSELSTTNGTWNGYPVPTYLYQWKRDGANIVTNGTLQNYFLVTDDVGATITCAVTAVNSAGNSSSTSNGLGPILASGNESDTIVSGGVTIVLSEPCVYGLTIDGMAWIVTPPGGVTILSRSPAQGLDGTNVISGTMKNPVRNAAALQAFDQRAPNYSAPLLQSFPIAVVQSDIVCGAVSEQIVTDTRQGVCNSYGAFFFVATAWADDAFAPSVVGWTGRGAITPYAVNVATIVAALPSLDVSAFSKPTVGSIIALVDQFQPGWAMSTSINYQYLTTRNSTDNVSNYGRYLAAPIGDALLFAVSNGPTLEEKTTIVKRIISSGIQMYDACEGSGFPQGPDGGHFQFFQSQCAFAVFHTGRSLSGIAVNTPGGIFGQPFQYDSTLLSHTQNPHSTITWPQTSRLRNANAVGPLYLDIATQNSRPGDSARCSWVSLKVVRQSDGAFAIVESQEQVTGGGDTTLLPSGTGAMRININAQPVPPFAANDQVYFLSQDPIRLTDADWAVREVVIGGDESQVNPAYTQPYRAPENRFADDIFFLRAAGVWHSSFNASELYTARANRTNDPSSGRDYGTHNEVFNNTNLPEQMWFTYGTQVLGQAPVYITSLVIAGAVNVDETLTVSDGAVAGAQPITKTLQWYRDGVAIAGQTGTTYTVVAGDLGSLLSVHEVSTNSFGTAELYSLSVGPVESGYVLNAVEFDGVTDWLYQNDVTPPSGTTRILCSLCFNFKAGTNFNILNANATGQQRFAFTINQANGSCSWFLRDTNNVTIWNAAAPAGTFVLGNWYTIVFGVDTSAEIGNGVGRAYIRPSGGEWRAIALSTNTVTADAIGAVMNRIGVGATNITGAGSGMLAYLAEVWLDFAQYIDLTDPSNLDKFLPTVSKGADGALVTGDSPGLFLSGPTATWHVNKGGYGGLTLNGVITTAPSIPT